MPCIDGNELKKRLLCAISHYEGKVQREGKCVSPQRQKDIEAITDLIHSVVDKTILEIEIRAYLNNIKTRTTWLSFFLTNHKKSHLRDTLMAILQDENRKYNLYVLCLTADYNRQENVAGLEGQTIETSGRWDDGVLCLSR